MSVQVCVSCVMIAKREQGGSVISATFTTVSSAQRAATPGEALYGIIACLTQGWWKKKKPYIAKIMIMK